MIAFSQGLVGCGRFHQFGYRILAALCWGLTIDTHPLRDMNRVGGGKHPAQCPKSTAREIFCSLTASRMTLQLLALYEDGLTEVISQVCRPAQQYRVTISVRLTFKVLW